MHAMSSKALKRGKRNRAMGIRLRWCCMIMKVMDLWEMLDLALWLL